MSVYNYASPPPPLHPPPALEVSSVLPLGSSDGTVQLLVNSTHLCRVALDHEFSKLAVLACMSVEPSLQVQCSYNYSI